MHQKSPSPPLNGIHGSVEEDQNRGEKEREENKRFTEETIDAAERLLREMQITKPDKVVTVIKPGDIGQKVNVQSNAFGLKLSECPIYRYDVVIHGDIGKKNVDFTKKSVSDHVVNERKRKCVAVFKKAVMMLTGYDQETTFFYDGQSIMFTTNKLVLKKETFESVGIPGEQVMEDLEPFALIHFVVKQCEESFECNVADVRKANRDLFQRDRSAAQFLEIASNMNPLVEFSERFTVFRNGRVFPNNPEAEGVKWRSLGEAKTLINGVKKSVRLIEGPKGRGSVSASLVVDSLKSPFHDAVNLIDKFQAVLASDLMRPLTNQQIETIHNQTKELGCRTTHLKKQRTVEIHGISRETAMTKIMEINIQGKNERMSVADYFHYKYQIALKYPHLPLVMSKERGQINLYPVELLEIIPMQRVGIKQTTSAQSQIMTKECAVDPAKRQVEIMQQVDLLGLNSRNKFLRAVGVNIISQPLVVGGRILPHPRLQYGGAAANPSSDGKWKTPVGNFKFVIPAACKMWAIYCLKTPRDQFNQANLFDFTKRFMGLCQQRGMRIPDPAECKFLEPRGEMSLETVTRMQMRTAAGHGCQFCFFISSEQIVFHKFIKLEERLSMMVTQDLKLRTAQNVIQKNQMQTLENIVCKTNVKLGGHNYAVDLRHITGNYNMLGPDRLILGLSVLRASSQGMADSLYGRPQAPAVIGFSANFAEMTTQFVGDFYYQEMDQVVHCLPEITKLVVRRFQGGIGEDGMEQTPTANLPKEIIVFRGGVDEIAYPNVVQTEVPYIRAAMKQAGIADPKLTYIVVHKEHGVRLMKTEINPNDKAPGQNIFSGTVVDQQLTNPTYVEFYLNSHITLQGTARTPRYTVLWDDSRYAMNELQLVAHSLAFDFQIVNSPVSIPAPLYVANRYAERGSALFTARTTDDLASSEQRQQTALAVINKDLPYRHCPLGGRRVNA